KAAPSKPGRPVPPRVPGGRLPDCRCARLNQEHVYVRSQHLLQELWRPDTDEEAQRQWERHIARLPLPCQLARMGGLLARRSRGIEGALTDQLAQYMSIERSVLATKKLNQSLPKPSQTPASRLTKLRAKACVACGFEEPAWLAYFEKCLLNDRRTVSLFDASLSPRRSHLLFCWPRARHSHECGVSTGRAGRSGSAGCHRPAAFSTVLVLRHRLDLLLADLIHRPGPLSENLVGRGCQRLSNGFDAQILNAIADLLAAPGKKGGSDGVKADESLMATIMSLIKKVRPTAQRTTFAYKSCDKLHPSTTIRHLSGTIFGLGDILSQLIAPKPGTGGQFSLRSTFAYSAFGFFISGPLIHAFYRQLDRALPRTLTNTLKRTLIDRLLLAPPYLLLLYYSVPLF
uniref:Mitochondrial carrier domain-containing protein n=1 Tax=Macrostomum lignano TaxID=282301 RepID=A0A1I8FIJ2_9PLAT